MAFDVTTHKRNSKGKIVNEQPYRLKISKGIKLFERPPESGNWYQENGDAVAAVAPVVKTEETAKGYKKLGEG